jgi:hypothetical protein
MRYIKNKLSNVIHDRQSLTERCNTDQLKWKQESDELRDLLAEDRKFKRSKFCQWCMKGRGE